MAHDKLKMLYKKLEANDPNINKIIMQAFMEKMPQEAYATLLFYKNEKEENYHLTTYEQYKEGVELLEWMEDKGEGEKWTCEDIMKLISINFENKDYTKYDFCYVMNMLWSDYCNVFQDHNYYLKMSKNYLEDPDYCGESSERAYHNARKRIKYNFDDED